MFLLGLVLAPTGILAIPGALLVGLAAASVGMAASTYMRKWQDFDMVAVVTTPMFLFSGTFFPITVYPDWLRIIVELRPSTAVCTCCAASRPGSSIRGAPRHRLPLGDEPHRRGYHRASAAHPAPEVSGRPAAPRPPALRPRAAGCRRAVAPPRGGPPTRAGSRRRSGGRPPAPRAEPARSPPRRAAEAVLPPDAQDAHRARRPVDARLDAADEPVAEQDRQHVVAPAPLGLGHVDLPDVVEAEEVAQQVAGPTRSGSSGAMKATPWSATERRPASARTAQWPTSSPRTYRCRARPRRPPDHSPAHERLPRSARSGYRRVAASAALPMPYR